MATDGARCRKCVKWPKDGNGKESQVTSSRGRVTVESGRVEAWGWACLKETGRRQRIGGGGNREVKVVVVGKRGENGESGRNANKEGRED